MSWEAEFIIINACVVGVSVITFLFIYGKLRKL